MNTHLKYAMASSFKRTGRGFRKKQFTLRAWFLLTLILVIAGFGILIQPFSRFSESSEVTHRYSGKNVHFFSNPTLALGPSELAITASFGGEGANIPEPALATVKTSMTPVKGASAADTEVAVKKVEAQNVPIKRGDTLMGLLVREGMAHTEAQGIVAALREVFNPRHLRLDHTLTMRYEVPRDDESRFKSLHLKLDNSRQVQVERCDTHGFKAREVIREFDTQPVRAEVVINSSLYQAASNVGVPSDILLQAIQIYAYSIDFQRDIQPQDHFEVLYELDVAKDGEVLRSGALQYAALTTQGRHLPVYRFQTRDGEIDYFDARGQSLKRALMITPIDGARISSGYGQRRHPILGYSRMHKGLDFAAPTGTPIMAAGDGVVEFAGRRGNYGNYIRLRHANEYHTAYAHLSRFARGIRSNARVRQGQIIGYVGSTGMSTGPHLHYEVHHRGQHINPASIRTKPGRVLTGEELQRFMATKKELDQLFASLKTPSEPPKDASRLALNE